MPNPANIYDIRICPSMNYIYIYIYIPTEYKFQIYKACDMPTITPRYKTCHRNYGTWQSINHQAAVVAVSKCEDIHNWAVTNVRIMLQFSSMSLKCHALKQLTMFRNHIVWWSDKLGLPVNRSYWMHIYDWMYVLVYRYVLFVDMNVFCNQNTGVASWNLQHNPD